MATRGFMVGPGGGYIGPDGAEVGPGIGLSPPTRPWQSPKTFVAHVYDSSETQLKGIWQVAGGLRYPWSINSGVGLCNLQLSRPWGRAGEKGETSSREDLEMGNVVKIWVIDRETQIGGVLRYRGVIEDYDQDLAGQLVSVNLAPRTTRFKDTTLTTDYVFATKTDPRDMVKALVDDGHLPGITFDSASPLLGLAFKYTFKAPLKVDQVLGLAQLFAGGNWFYRLNLDDSLHFGYWNIHQEPDHKLIIGRHVSQDVHFRKSQVSLKKRVIFTGQQTLTVTPSDGGGATTTLTKPFDVSVQLQGYDPAIDPRDLFSSNSRVTTPEAARRVAHALLEYFSKPFYETTFTVIDSNVDPTKGYDIESLMPGQTLSLINPENRFLPRKWGTGHYAYGSGAIWGGTRVEQVQRPLVIADIDYQFDRATLTLRNRPVDVPAQLVELGERLALVGG